MVAEEGQQREAGSRPPPDRLRGPTRPLSERAARYAAESQLLDRRQRWQQRLADVEADTVRRRRRSAVVTVASWATTLVASTVIGWITLGWHGVAAAVGAVVIAAGGVFLGRSLARRRGASAWDWQVQRYRLWGDPSAEVQRRDRPAARWPTGRD